MFLTSLAIGQVVILPECPIPILTKSKIQTNSIQRSSGNRTVGVGNGTAALGAVLFMETFGAGLAGDGANGAWTTNGLDGTGTVDPDAIWEYRGVGTSPDNTVGSRGAYSGQTGIIASPTVANGFFIFDSDFLDNAGVAGAFGTGLSPTPHESWLVSPSFSTMGATDVSINFNTYFRRFQGDAYVLLSIDGGATWGDSVVIFDTDFGVNLASSEGKAIDTKVNFIANQANVRIAFYFDGITNGDGYYFVMIDDVVISESPDHNMALDGSFYRTSNDTGSTVYYSMVPIMVAALDTIQFSGNVTNQGGMDQTNVMYHNAYSTPNGTTITLSSVGVSVASGASDSLVVTTDVVLDQGVGMYSWAYSVSADSTDDVPANNFADSVFVEVTDSTFALDRNADGDSWYGAGSSFEIGPLFTIYDTVKATSISVRLGSGSLNNETFSVYLYKRDSVGDFIFMTAKEFMTYDSTLYAGQLMDIAIPETLLEPGQYLVTFKTYDDKIYFPRSLVDADPQMVFVAPSDGGTWYSTSAIPVVRLNVTDDLNVVVCDMYVDVYRIGNGVYKAFVNRGTPPYSYLWDNGDTTITSGFFCVTVTDSNLCTTHGCPLGSVNELPIKGDISIIPNPNRGTFQLDLEGVKAGAYSVKVMSLIGQTVYQNTVAVNGNYNENISISNLESGVYFMEIANTNSEKSVIRFVVK